jgi:hypothetical protein
MNAKRKLQLLKKPESSEPEIQRGGRDYVRIQPGIYTGRCQRTRTYRDPIFRHWTCLLVFNLFEPTSGDTIANGIPIWYALGQGEHPLASRRGKYFPAWILANDGRAPQRQDRMPPKIFVGRVAKVRVSDTKGPAPYSKVAAILCWETSAKAGS